MRTSERNTKLRALGDLAEQDRYVLGNARCLSEGVDVPTLDGVAFVDPRRSEIDIVQAVGRAIRLDRTNENKIGTIVIPVFIEVGDDPDKKISASEFDQVWKVVTALRSHDETLGEELDEFRVSLGRKQKISVVGDKIILDVHQSIDASFTTAFETKLVEATTASWMFWFGMLRDFVQAEGHCNVHLHYKTTEGYRLGGWLSNQRKYYKTGQLSDDRIRLLEAMGIVWDAPAAKWEQGFAAFKTYKNAEGDCDVHSTHRTADGYRLGAWLSKQAIAYKKGELSDNRVARLEAQWEEAIVGLKTYKNAEGHCDVHNHYKTAKGFA